MKSYREQALDMLARWGKEIAEGHSKPNILAQDYVGGDGTQWPSGPASFSPLAEMADKVLRDIGQYDREGLDMLVSRALGLRIEDIARRNKTHNNRIQILTEGALGAFAMNLHIRSRRGVWNDIADLKGEIGDMKRKRANVLDYLKGE